MPGPRWLPAWLVATGPGIRAVPFIEASLEWPSSSLVHGSCRPCGCRDGQVPHSRAGRWQTASMTLTSQSAIASQITAKHETFFNGLRRLTVKRTSRYRITHTVPMDSTDKGPVMRTMFPCHASRGNLHFYKFLVTLLYVE